MIIEKSIKQLLKIYKLNPHKDKKILYKNKLTLLMKLKRKMIEKKHKFIEQMKLVMKVVLNYLQK